MRQKPLQERSLQRIILVFIVYFCAFKCIQVSCNPMIPNQDKELLIQKEMNGLLQFKHNGISLFAQNSKKQDLSGKDLHERDDEPSEESFQEVLPKSDNGLTWQKEGHEFFLLQDRDISLFAGFLEKADFKSQVFNGEDDCNKEEMQIADRQLFGQNLLNTRKQTQQSLFYNMFADIPQTMLIFSFDYALVICLIAWLKKWRSYKSQQWIFVGLILGYSLFANVSAYSFKVNETISNDMRIREYSPDTNYGSDDEFYISTQYRSIGLWQTDSFILLSQPLTDYNPSAYQLNSLTLTLHVWASVFDFPDTNSLMIYQAQNYNLSGTWASENNKYDANKAFQRVDVSKSILGGCSSALCDFELNVNLTDVGKELLESDPLSLYLTFDQKCDSSMSGCNNEIDFRGSRYTRNSSEQPHVVWDFSCKDGYYKSQDGACQACDVSCKSCTAAGSAMCGICQDGFYKFQNSTCQACYEKCRTCNGKSSSDCLSCQPGYQLIDMSCLQSSLVCPVPTIAPCSDCISEECNQCMDQYYKTTNSSCQEVLPPTCQNACSHSNASDVNNQTILISLVLIGISVIFIGFFMCAKKLKARRNGPGNDNDDCAQGENEVIEMGGIEMGANT